MSSYKRLYTCAVCFATNSSDTDGTTFHLFPRKKVKRAVWCEFLQLPSINKHSRICSKHFIEDDFTISKQNRKIFKPWVIPLRHCTTTRNTLNPTTNASQDDEEQQMLQIDTPSTANTSHTTPTKTLEPMQTTSANSSSDSLIIEVSPTSCAYISNIKTIYSFDDIDVIYSDGDTDDDTLSELLKMHFGSNQINDILQEKNFSNISKSKKTLFKLKNIILSLCQDKDALQQKIKNLEHQYKSAVNMVEELGGHITNDPTIHHV